MSPAARILTDRNGRIVECSAGTGELFAIEERWLPGKPLAAFVAIERVREFRKLLIELSHGSGPVATSLRVQRRDGRRVDVELQAVAAHEGIDRLEWLLARPEEEAAEDDEEEAVNAFRVLPLRRLLTRLPLGVVSFDENLVVDFVNPLARLYLDGVRVGARLPDPFAEFSLPDFAQRLFGPSPPVRQVVETAKGRLLELEGVNATESGSPILLIHDVTANERRRRAEHEFAANAAHELRTPIAAITSALDVLNAGAKEVPADRDRFLGHIEHETARLTRLVATLLLLARVQTGQELPSLELLAAGPLLDEVAAGLEPQEGVRLYVDCPADLSLLADFDLLRQAVWNLALNAVKHTREGEICLAGRDLGSVAEIEVSDTGSGIAPEDHARIFDRFYRAQRRGGGFGLGLPLSKEIARALGGTLTLESEPGVGTRARLHVPSARLVA